VLIAEPQHNLVPVRGLPEHAGRDTTTARADEEPFTQERHSPCLVGRVLVECM